MSDMLTPSQTVGPFLAIVLPWPDGPDVVPPGTPGRIEISGYVRDGAGDPVPDAMVETWQAGPDGRFDHPDDVRGAVAGFRGFGRASTDADGRYAIFTLIPGALPTRDGALEAPHIDVSVFARGLLDRVVTRIYFDADADDPVLASVPAERRGTLIATRAGDGFRFDINLQGPAETVFFEV
ncbi:MAG TPA: protocatechuate 3,4-dioxygenase subunit alpha [Micromonosporaceae bacterium]